MFNRFKFNCRKFLNGTASLLRLPVEAFRRRNPAHFRAKATKAAKARIQEVQLILGDQSESLHTFLRLEKSYEIRRFSVFKLRSCTANAIKLAHVLVAITSCWIGFFLFASGLESRSKTFCCVAIAESSHILAVIAGLIAVRYTAKIGKEMRGLLDPQAASALLSCSARSALIGGSYFLLFGIAPNFTDTLVTADFQLVFFYTVVASVGLFFLAIGLSTFLSLTFARLYIRSRLCYIAINAPQETVVHELLSALLLLNSSGNVQMRPLCKYRLAGHLELAAFAVERGLGQQLALEDPTTSALVASNLECIANGIRELNTWIATPRHDTFGNLEARLLGSVRAAAAGHWDELPFGEHKNRRGSATKNILVVLVIITTAGIFSTFLAALIGRAVGLEVSSMIPIFIALMPLLTSYMINLAMPDSTFGSSRLK